MSTRNASMCTTHDDAWDQHLLDLAFRDLDHYLASTRKVEECRNGCCVSCGHRGISFSGSDSSYPGSAVCDECGVVQPGLVLFETMYGFDLPTKASNYKRIHHWHERISQLLLCESQISARDMLAIAERLCDGTHTVISKDSIRAVLRSLNMQQYIEKWLQIIYRITHIAPPTPGSSLIRKLDEMFLELQEPFNCHRDNARKNFLNYNYVFCRLLQMLKCTQFCMFFPLISSSKIKKLDVVWNKMATTLKWPVEPLEQVDPFAVRLEQPLLSLQRLASECDSQVPIAPRIASMQMVFRTLDRRSVARVLAGPKRRRSDPSESESQTGAAEQKRRRCAAAGRPRLQNRRARLS